MKKNILKHSLFLLCITSIILSTTVTNAQETTTPPENKKTIGLTFGLDYYSTYLWRGTYFYGGDGAFVPSISWSIFSTGLSIGIAGEFDSEYFFESSKGNNGRNAPGFDYHSVDFGINYSHTFADLVTLGAGAWFWYYFNSEDAGGADASFMTLTTSVAFNVLLSPFISLTWDYYIDENFAADKKNMEDIYLQFGIGHTFDIKKIAAINLGLSAAFYNGRSFGKDVIGISDITTSFGISVSAGIVTVTGGFNYIIVPMKEFYNIGDLNDMHRWNATFGASVSI